MGSTQCAHVNRQRSRSIVFFFIEKYSVNRRYDRQYAYVIGQCSREERLALAVGVRSRKSIDMTIANSRTPEDPLVILGRALDEITTLTGSVDVFSVKISVRAADRLLTSAQRDRTENQRLTRKLRRQRRELRMLRRHALGWATYVRREHGLAE